MSKKGSTKSFKGCSLFRHRIVAATLSGKAIGISDIRANTVRA
jgi:RNA 3'-terminal phosphate cyclase